MKPEDKQLLDVVVKPIEEAARAAQDALNRALRERVAQEKNAATDSGQPQPRPEEKRPPRERRDSRGRKLPRGVFEPKPGEYWIRFADSTGKIRREKIGPLVGPVGDAYHKRRSEAKEGKIFPESMRGRTPVLFQEIARDFLVYSKRKSGITSTISPALRGF
ncbi:MAG TPA: hypothetical protein VGX94_00215 [Terriglobia bacterium]|nr:hypothetical protein [Terriglobia bacterium]